MYDRPYRIQLIQRPKLNGLGCHEGVLLVFDWGCVVYHKTTHGLQRDSFDAFAEGRQVSVVAECSHLSEALDRLRAALAENREYALVGDNCQNFARYVVQGRSESPDIQLVTVIGFVAFLFRLDQAA